MPSSGISDSSSIGFFSCWVSTGLGGFGFLVSGSPLSFFSISSGVMVSTGRGFFPLSGSGGLGSGFSFSFMGFSLGLGSGFFISGGFLVSFF